jgi:hypothetical protein
MYTLTNDPDWVIRDDGAHVPIMEGGSGREDYVKWRDGWVETVIDTPSVVAVLDTNGVEVVPAIQAVTHTIQHPANVPMLPVSPPPPTVITMRQARLALLQAGLLPVVNAAITAMSGSTGDAARIEWEFSSDVVRTRPLITQLATGLGLTSAQLDGLFTLAASFL